MLAAALEAAPSDCRQNRLMTEVQELYEPAAGLQLFSGLCSQFGTPSTEPPTLLFSSHPEATVVQTLVQCTHTTLCNPCVRTICGASFNASRRLSSSFATIAAVEHRWIVTPDGKVSNRTFDLPSVEAMTPEDFVHALDVVVEVVIAQY